MSAMTLRVPLRTALAVVTTALAGCAYNFPGPEPVPTPPPASLAQAFGEARLLHASGEPEAARELLVKWVDEARASGSDARLAAALNDLGLVESWSARPAEAMAAFSRSAGLASASGEPALAARASLNAADVLRRKGDAGAAQEAVDRAIALVPAVPGADEKSLLLSGAAARMGPPFPARRQAILEEALAHADAAGALRLRSQALGLLAEQAQQAGRGDEARDAARKAIFAAQAAQAPDLLFRWEWLAARLAESRGEDGAALAHYRRAHASLAAFRHDLLIELRLARESYRDAIGPAFTGYADLLLRTADGERDPAARRERLLEARAAVEQMKAVELEDYFQDECVARFSRSRRKARVRASSAADDTGTLTFSISSPALTSRSRRPGRITG